MHWNIKGDNSPFFIDYHQDPKIVVLDGEKLREQMRCLNMVEDEATEGNLVI